MIDFVAYAVAIGYAIAAVLVVVRGVQVRLDLRRGPNLAEGQSLTAAELAFLAGEVEPGDDGPRRAVEASIQALRSAGAIVVTPSGEAGSAGPLPDGAEPLDQAVYAAVQQEVPRDQLLADAGVGAALDAVEANLVADGWLLSVEDHHRWRRGGYQALLLFGLGIFLWAGSVATSFIPTLGAFLIFGYAILPLLIASAMLLDKAPPDVSEAARTLVTQLRATVAG